MGCSSCGQTVNIAQTKPIVNNITQTKPMQFGNPSIHGKPKIIKAK